jgi:hypothetical protein
VTNDWNNLSKDTVSSISAKVFKRRLDKEWDAKPSRYN